MLPIEVNPHLKSGEREDGRRTRKSGSVSTPAPESPTVDNPSSHRQQETFAFDLVVNPDPCLKSQK